MKRTYDETLKATIVSDGDGQLRSIKSLDVFPELAGFAQPDVVGYLKRIAGRLKLPGDSLRDPQLPVAFGEPRRLDPEYRFCDEKTFFDSTTYAYYQTYLNVPVWASGISVTVSHQPARVLSVTNTSESGIDAKLPTAKAITRYRQLFAGGEKIDEKPSKPGARQSKAAIERVSRELEEILGDAAGGSKDRRGRKVPPKLIRGRFFVYCYDDERRISDSTTGGKDDPSYGTGHEGGHHCCGIPPTLPLPAAPNSIKAGHWYLTAELVFRLPHQGDPMNWRMLVDVETDTILYLRALTSGVSGSVFIHDPITSTGTSTNTPDQGNAVLNPHRDSVVLENLDPPSGGTQSLQGSLVSLVNIESPNESPPTQPAGNDFDYDARTNEFAAVNAYYHNDRFFRLVADLGFTLTGASGYFDGTSFPVEVDHRGLGNAVNAHCIGDGDGIDHTCYALADAGDTANPIGIATDWRVVLHELGGHGILYDHVNSANFGFAHSAGDSFAVILNDYVSEWHNGAAVDRFLLAPFVPSVPRRSDRTVAAGWGWGGANDVGGYSSEQILSTTLFRVYRSIGGDSAQFSRREFAARCMAYLMLRAVGTLTPLSNPGSPAQFLDALLTADDGNWTTEGVYGGAYGKVLSWSFEKQNLNDGDPPHVDVYIDDGRGGEYEYQPVHWETATIWNRRMADGIEGHQEPTIGTNYAYVKIRNRGTNEANNVVVKGFHCKPLAGLVWPDDLQPMATPELPGGTLQPNDAEEKVIGPFAWTPVENAVGHDSMLMIVSATGDPSNVDKFVAGESVEDWRLIPNDNNIALRNVKLEPRLVTVIADDGDFGNVCLGSFRDLALVLSNSGFNTLSIHNIVSSSPEFIVPGVLPYPIVIESGDSVTVPIRLQPGSLGAKAATIRLFSDDPEGPKKVQVSGRAGAPRLVTIIADDGDFGDVCGGSFRDQMVTLSNSGCCPLKITGISSSSPEFVVPGVVAYPIKIDAGDAVQVPIRFAPTGIGAKSGTIKIASDDPDGPDQFRVRGNAPSGKLVVTGSTCIGGVKACCLGERAIRLCNVGDCKLHVSSVGFKRESRYWKLVNNPFPATLHPGACLEVLIRYRAGEKCPKCCELVIRSDDPTTPVRVLDVMAYTVWEQPGCHGECEDCEKACGNAKDPCCTPQSIDACCWDEDCEDGEQ